MWTHLTIFLNHSSLFFIRTFPWIIPYCPSLQSFHGLFLNASHLTLSLDLGGTGMQHIQVINHAGSSGTNTINMSAPVFQEFDQCKHCDQPISSTGKTSSNLLRHLEAKHESLYKLIKTPAKTDAQSSMKTFAVTIPGAPLQKFKCDHPLQYWKENQSTYPDLAKLACCYLHIPASSAPVERIFSIAGRVFRPDRNRLSDKRFQQLMFIGCNKL